MNVGCDATAPAASTWRIRLTQHHQSGEAWLCSGERRMHSVPFQGQPLKNLIQGKYYDWPVGFHVG